MHIVYRLCVQTTALSSLSSDRGCLGGMNRVLFAGLRASTPGRRSKTLCPVGPLQRGSLGGLGFCL